MGLGGAPKLHTKFLCVLIEIGLRAQSMITLLGSLKVNMSGGTYMTN